MISAFSVLKQKLTCRLSPHTFLEFIMKMLTQLLPILLVFGTVQVAFASENEANEQHKRNEQQVTSKHRETRNDQDDKQILNDTMIGDDVINKKPTSAPASAPANDFLAGTTLENLQAAYDGESNAAAKYAAFAKKADEEGYGAVASLFRAASRAEEIHRDNHAVVIRSMGAAPKANVKPVDLKTTADNLKAAVEGESFERDFMYPAYMKIARQDQNRNALRTFNYAQIAESHHASYYTEAGEKLIEYKDSKGKMWYVCPTCGETIAAEDFTQFSKCPVCFTATSTFVPIS